MKTQIVVLSVDHYQMEDNRGANVRILGSDEVNTDFKTGLDVVNAPMPYEELGSVLTVAGNFPALFECSVDFTTVKDRNGRDRAGMSVKNLKFISKLDLVPTKESK